MVDAATLGAIFGGAVLVWVGGLTVGIAIGWVRRIRDVA